LTTVGMPRGDSTHLKTPAAQYLRISAKTLSALGMGCRFGPGIGGIRSDGLAALQILRILDIFWIYVGEP